MPRKYFPTIFNSVVGPFNLDSAAGKWVGPTGKICDEINNYFALPAGTTTFSVEAVTVQPTDRPFVEVQIFEGPPRQDCLSYHCPARSDKNFKVQEALRPLADRFWAQRPAGTTRLTVYVSMFAAD